MIKSRKPFSLGTWIFIGLIIIVSSIYIYGLSQRNNVQKYADLHIENRIYKKSMNFMGSKVQISNRHVNPVKQTITYTLKFKPALSATKIQDNILDNCYLVNKRAMHVDMLDSKRVNNLTSRSQSSLVRPTNEKLSKISGTALFPKSLKEINTDLVFVTYSSSKHAYIFSYLNPSHS